MQFFAWNQQWKQRAADARKAEMKQMVRCELESVTVLMQALINGIYFSLLWALAPLLVTLVSFFWFVSHVEPLLTSFIVFMKRDLTVSIAFTSISLFSMLRMPLNVIPTYVR